MPLGWFKVCVLGWLVNVYSSHSIHRGTAQAHKVSTHNAKRPIYIQTGWDHGGGHIGLGSSLGLVPKYVALVLGIEGGVLLISKAVIVHGA